MTPDFVRQADAPLFPQILYNRPVTRSGAGRLLVAGGHTGELSQPTAIYQLAMASGAGECIVALPDALIKLLGGAPATTFVPSSPSGSLGREALGPLLHLSEDMDAILLGVSLSNNSETAILSERLSQEAERPIIAVDEAIGLLLASPDALLSKPDNLLVVTMPQIFKLGDKLGVQIQIRPGGGLMNKLEIVAAVANKIKATLMVYGTEIIVASPGEAPVVTPIDYRLSQYPTTFYALAAVFWLQNRSQRRAGLITAAYLLGKLSHHIRTDHHFTVSELAKLIRTELEVGEGF